MQKFKNFIGSVSSIVSRTVYPSYGVSTSEQVYAQKGAVINEKIAEFLRECGVDAKYEQRTGASSEYIWIHGLPILYSFAYNGNLGKLSFPFTTSFNVSVSSTPFPSYTSLDYNFNAIFTGSPDAFLLRITAYNTTKITTDYSLKVLKGKNILNGKNGVLWSVGTSSNVSNASTYSMRSMDVDENEVPIRESYCEELRISSVIKDMKPVDLSNNPDKLILEPITIGPYRLNGVFYRPTNWGLPAAESGTVLLQTEIEVGGRRFIVTNSDSATPSTINMGLVEVTDDSEVDVP